MGAQESHRGPSGKILPGLKLDISEAQERLRAVFSDTRVVLAYLFGSYARADAGAGSDIDIAVLLDAQGPDLYADYRYLMLATREALQTERFDLLLLNSAAPTLRFAVVTEGRLLYARSEEDTNRFEEAVIRTMQDTAHLRAVQEQYLRGRARAWYSEKKA